MIRMWRWKMNLTPPPKCEILVRLNCRYCSTRFIYCVAVIGVGDGGSRGDRPPQVSGRGAEVSFRPPRF